MLLQHGFVQIEAKSFDRKEAASISHTISSCELEFELDSRDRDGELVVLLVPIVLCPLSDSLSESLSGKVTGFLTIGAISNSSRNFPNISLDSLKPFSSK